MTAKTKSEKKQIVRHSPTVRIIHWTVTISVFLLIFSGIGQMPMYKRYMLDQLPAMAWTSDYAVTLILHYVAAMALMAAAVFHLVYHGLRRDFNIIPRKGDLKESYLIIKAILTKGKEPPSHKYLAEQRLAYVFIAGSIALTIITGLIKVLKNLPSVSISSETLYWTTLFHNIGTFLVVFGIIAHLGAFIIKENRILLPAIFTGKVDLGYIKHRHSLWYQELVNNKYPLPDLIKNMPGNAGKDESKENTA